MQHLRQTLLRSSWHTGADGSISPYQNHEIPSEGSCHKKRNELEMCAELAAVKSGVLSNFW